VVTTTRDQITLLEKLPNLTSSAAVLRDNGGVLLLRVAAHVVELLEAPLLGHLLRGFTSRSYKERKIGISFGLP
jgi:hypothetical protein